MVHWQYFPRSERAPSFVLELVEIVEKSHSSISSEFNSLPSDQVLSILRPLLETNGFVVEKGKKHDEKVHVPVLYGPNGKLEKSFDADAFNSEYGFVVEIEAGRAVVNFQFLKDLFQACMMSDVLYLGIVVRNKYKNSNDFERVRVFLDTLYTSGRLQLPLKGIVVIGY